MFLAQIITDKKKALRKAEVPSDEAPKWPELGLMQVFAKVKDDVELMMHLPDPRAEGAKYDRTFFWGVLFAVRGRFCHELIREAAELREAGFGKRMIPKFNTFTNIGITGTWASLLM